VRVRFDFAALDVKVTRAGFMDADRTCRLGEFSERRGPAHASAEFLCNERANPHTLCELTMKSGIKCDGPSTSVTFSRPAPKNRSVLAPITPPPITARLRRNVIHLQERVRVEYPHIVESDFRRAMACFR